MLEIMMKNSSPSGWEDADLGIAEVEDAKERLAALK